jgi:hypothetical protein
VVASMSAAARNASLISGILLIIDPFLVIRPGQAQRQSVGRFNPPPALSPGESSSMN